MSNPPPAVHEMHEDHMDEDGPVPWFRVCFKTAKTLYINNWLIVIVMNVLLAVAAYIPFTFMLLVGPAVGCYLNFLLTCLHNPEGDFKAEFGDAFAIGKAGGLTIVNLAFGTWFLYVVGVIGGYASAFLCGLPLLILIPIIMYYYPLLAFKSFNGEVNVITAFIRSWKAWNGTGYWNHWKFTALLFICMIIPYLSIIAIPFPLGLFLFYAVIFISHFTWGAILFIAMFVGYKQVFHDSFNEYDSPWQMREEVVDDGNVA